MVLRAGVALLLLVAGAGCSLLTPLGELTAGDNDAGNNVARSNDGTDGAMPDGAGAADALPDVGLKDAGGGEAAGAPNLVTHGDFEDPSVTECGPPWTPFQSTLVRTTDAHSGTGACKVCGTASHTIFTIDGFDLAGGSTGETYTASAWVRAAPGAPLPGGFDLNLRVYVGGVDVEDGASPRVACTTSWQKVEFTHTLAVNPERLNIYGAATGSAPGGCFLIDDITLVRQ